MNNYNYNETFTNERNFDIELPIRNWYAVNTYKPLPVKQILALDNPRRINML